MGDTFDRVSEVKKQSALAEKIKILADYVTIVSKADVDEDMFLFASKPSQLGSDEANTWEGSIVQLKNAIDRAIYKHEDLFSKHVLTISERMDKLRIRLCNFDDRISELSDAQERLPIAI